MKRIISLLCLMSCGGFLSAMDNPETNSSRLKFPKRIFYQVHPNNLSEGPLEHEQYIIALNYAESKLLQGPLSQLTADEFLKHLKLLNLYLCNESKGKVRTKSTLVIDRAKVKDIPGSSDSLEEVEIFLNSQPNASELLKHFYSTIDKSNQYGSAEASLEHWTPEEWKVWKSFCYFPPHPSVLMDQYYKFHAELLKMYENKDNPIDIAAFAHYELTRLHLFKDANGRSARIIMNIILMQSDIEPQIFEHNNEYDTANHSFETFKAYLKKIINKQYCSKCKKIEKKSIPLKRCGKCKTAKYCSRECQSANWSIHKKECSPV